MVCIRWAATVLEARTLQATALSGRAITTWAGKAGIHRYRFHAAAEQAPQIGIVVAKVLGFHRVWIFILGADENCSF
jgi:hypothetical protein